MAEKNFQEDPTEQTLASIQTELASRLTDLDKHNRLDPASVDEAVEGYLRSIKLGPTDISGEQIGEMVKGAFERQGLETRKSYVLDEVMEKYRAVQ